MCSLIAKLVASRSLILPAPRTVKNMCTFASDAVYRLGFVSCKPNLIGYLPPSNPDKVISDPRLVDDVYTVPGLQPRIIELILPTSLNTNAEIRDDDKTENSRSGFLCKEAYYNNMLWIRHRKMKKHQRRKWKKKYLTLILKTRLKREIKKEKLFRAELLTQIMEAEKFDAETYVKNVLKTIENKPKEISLEERYQRALELIRQNRKETSTVDPAFDDPVPSGPYKPKN